MTDLLQIKIDEAKRQLPEETRRAIDVVPWKEAIMGLRESKGYTFEQLGDLETETELLLCGLLNPDDYPKELETRMKLTKDNVKELIEEMSKLVFSKIREELIKNSERTKIFNSHTGTASSGMVAKKNSPIAQINRSDLGVLGKAGIKIMPTRPQNGSMMGGNPNLNTPEIMAPNKAQ